MSIIQLTTEELWLEQRMLAKAMRVYQEQSAPIHAALDLCDAFFEGKKISLKKLHATLDQCEKPMAAANDQYMRLDLADICGGISIRIMLGFVMTCIDTKGRPHPAIVAHVQEINGLMTAVGDPCFARADRTPSHSPRERIAQQGPRPRAYHR